MDIHVYIHTDGDHKLDEILRLLRNIKLEEDKIMALSQETKDLIAKLDVITDAIATRLQKLIDAAAQSGSVTEAELRAALQPEVARLNALGADPANPVPTN